MSQIKSEAEIKIEKIFAQAMFQDEVRDAVLDYTAMLKETMAYYRCAMMEVSTKFNVLNEELSLAYDRNPIESIKTRLKSINSIIQKLQRRGLPMTAESLRENINDVAGVRVICSFPSDIYMLAEAFLKQDDIMLLQCKDYIKNPKPNGYRSLHLVVNIPIYLQNEKKLMKVEVQFRTISMDCWASLEHKIRYKKNISISDEIDRELLECAQISETLDRRMEEIQRRVEESRELE